MQTIAHADGAPTPDAYRLRASLRDARPAVWRELVVPADLTLWELHRVLLVVFGWSNSHLFQFDVGPLHYRDPHIEDVEPDDVFATEVRLDEIAREHKTFVYTYDLGTSWTHDIEIVRPAISTETSTFVVCAGGEGIVPDENSSKRRRGRFDLDLVNGVLPGVIAPRPRIPKPRDSRMSTSMLEADAVQHGEARIADSFT